MHLLLKAAARERRAPIYWWLALMVGTGGMLVAFVGYHYESPHYALLIAIVLGAAWSAPLVAYQSLAAPHRADTPAPPPGGGGSYREWMKQARMLGRLLLYYADNRDMPPELRKILHAARLDLRDTLRAHPLRDDLERVCLRIRAEAVERMKAWLWKEHRYRVREILLRYETQVAAEPDEDERLIALQTAVEDAAAEMSRYCMPRLLERERLMCARDCAWLASQTAYGHGGRFSPVELAGALVIEWGDFSEPWQPARMLHRAVVSMELSAAPSPGSAAAPAVPGAETPRTLRRVRVRVRRDSRRHHRRRRGPSLVDIFLSFGQWVRYSVRSFMLYR
jgi:hypothetical protein